MGYEIIQIQFSGIKVGHTFNTKFEVQLIDNNSMNIIRAYNRLTLNNRPFRAHTLFRFFLFFHTKTLSPRD